MDNISFLRERQNDKQKFLFDYPNNSGSSSTYKVRNIYYIDTEKGTVKLFLLNNSKYYVFTIHKMKNIRLINEAQCPIKSSNNSIENLKNYYIEIIHLLMKNNKEKTDNPEGLNYFLNHVKNMFSDTKAIKKNKTLFSKYLNGKETEKKLWQDDIMLMPFISNQSQKCAIKNAMNYDISVIQGPPGTGKTQTILNIVANYIYAGKKVCVVSKNNSAINNVYEKFSKCNELCNFSLRLGNNKDYIPELMATIEEKIKEDYKFKTERIVTDFKYFKKIYDEIEITEKKYDSLIQRQNLLHDVRNDKRHVDRKIIVYKNGLEDIQVNPFFLSLTLLKREIELLKNIKNVNKEMKYNLVFKLYSKFRFNTYHIDTSIFTMYQWRLEQLYANRMISKLEKEIINVDQLREQLGLKYKEYNSMSIDMINEKIIQNFISKKSEADVLLSELKDGSFNKIKKYLFDLYPVILTTLDSVCSNIGNTKFDLVIIDETSQADIITCLPTLNIGEALVVVGDSKQLSHIVNSSLKEEDIKLLQKYNIKEEYSYSKTNALNSFLEVFNPPTILLKEHYRCDYNIINYCNKMYYNDELLIYSKEANPASMKIMVLDFEKNSDRDKRINGNNSYFNKIEEKAIIKYCKDDFTNLSIITPFGKQEENLIDALESLKDEIGTIYKFQGRENNRVLLSTVLTKESNLIENTDVLNDETINVAVSRAKEEFVLFVHKSFFEKSNHNLQYLISYIETYGEKLESNINSIFAHLYKQIPYVKLDKKYDSLWEKVIHEALVETQEKFKGFFVVLKHSLADVIINEEYLNENTDLRSFALNKNTHIDFLLISELNNQPILAIEIDGKMHSKPDQKERDAKKDKILKDNGIPIWRIKSTDALEKEDIETKINEQVKVFKNNLEEFVSIHSWKRQDQ